MSSGSHLSHRPHRPVMLKQALEAIAPEEGGIYVDGTFGAGGYSQGILKRANCFVWAIDRDPDALSIGQEMERENRNRFSILHGCFGDMVGLLEKVGIERVDGVVLDIGVSSMQLDKAGRGFSFTLDGPLDMRMGQSGNTASDLVNTVEENVLSDIIYWLGGEKASRHIARAIVAERQIRPFVRTQHLAGIVRKAVRSSKFSKTEHIDPATRTFQALRLWVNDELGELERGLRGAELLLRAGGRLVVVSFHSLEDRKVKEFLQERCGYAAKTSRYLPEKKPPQEPSFTFFDRRKAQKPSADEVVRNPRARSARLRSAERTNAPAWSLEQGVRT